jgi:hypothetical protein
MYDDDRVTALLALVESSVAESAADLGVEEDEVFWDVANSVVRYLGAYEVEGLTDEDRVETCRILGIEWA